MELDPSLAFSGHASAFPQLLPHLLSNTRTLRLHERIAEITWNSLGASPAAALARALDRARASGFDTLLISDAEAMDVPLADVAAACASRDLGLWLVLSPDKDGHPVFGAHATPPLDPWLVDADAALDPRRSLLSMRAAPIVDATSLFDAWESKLAAAIDAGTGGFVCRDPDRLPASFWSGLIDAARARSNAPRWIAWTPGLAEPDVDALSDHGFDTLCSSASWWDGRSHWLTEELHRMGDAQTLAFPVDPFETDTQHDGVPLANQQRIWVAALVADALLVPHGWWRSTNDEIDAEIVAVNRWFASRGAEGGATGLRFISGPDAGATLIAKSSHTDLRASDHVTLVMLNADCKQKVSVAGSSITTPLSGFGRFDQITLTDGVLADIDACSTIELPPCGLRVLTASRLPVVRIPVAPGRRSAIHAVQSPRIAIEAITPTVENGRFPVKRTAGEAVRVEADIIIDGHEKLAAVLMYRAIGDREWREVFMDPIGNDRFAASFPLQRVGRHEFTIEAWRDVFATYRNELDKKFAAGLDVSLELIEGRLLVDDSLAHARTLKKPDLVRRLTSLSRLLASHRVDDEPGTDASIDRRSMADSVAALLASQTRLDMPLADRRAFAMRPDTAFPIDAERRQASFASWYELFPRSLGNPPGVEATHHGTFDDVIARLPAVRAMGFDVLYFPPIHPIGQRNRKGRNNSLTALEDDPGSPYAIGSAEGGHDALHPQLGTFEDFKRLRDAALDQGLELALDFAIQCSPDHPWLQDHPGWFAWRPDGSLRYAENPPKKYEDIVNVDFYGEGKKGDAAPALWAALRDVILLWVEHDVRIFRVDNPHTKPLPFWEWMIGEVRAKYPDVIFLSEAFTRPKVMYRLAKVGFSQSYTYFTWRHTKQEFIDYITELTGPESRESLHAAPRDFFRPNFFVNTPDINPVFLQRSGRAGFLIRAALAATLSGLWGAYSGFELCEAAPVPGKEDYLDSEKYQLRAWDWQRPGNIVAEITALNRIRNENPAMQTHLSVRFQNVFDPNILYFVKATEDRSNIVVVAINLDPYGVHEADFEIPLWEWGRDDNASVEVTDLLDGHRFRWQGKVQHMRLDPGFNPYAVWRVSLSR
jgi:starch synthase (maltosyl-transferring)